jgi:3',5'-cyclic AMP phosphodiesterase CpdA
MQRREFLRSLGWSLAGGWTVSRWGWPAPAQAATGKVRLALLADSHLPDGDDRRSEARALARAVAEMRGLTPPPDLVLFAGDLAHAGSAEALALGQEILSDLPAPLAAVRGEGDVSGSGPTWRRLFGEPRFSQVFSANPSYPGLPNPREGLNLNANLLRKTQNEKRKTIVQILGLDTSLAPSPQGPVFQVGREQRQWLSRELARLDPGMPLVILSHAPLVEIFRPWRQWTQDGPEVMRLLSRFSQVYCFYGHVHHEAVSDQLSAFSLFTENGKRQTGTEDRRPKTENHPLPATSWPLPSPLQGTPAAASPGLGLRGCGWALATLEDASLTYQPRVWLG